MSKIFFFGENSFVYKNNASFPEDSIWVYKKNWFYKKNGFT